MSTILNARKGKGIFPDSMFEDSMQRAGREHDGIKVGVKFLRFLLDDLDELK